MSCGCLPTPKLTKLPPACPVQLRYDRVLFLSPRSLHLSPCEKPSWPSMLGLACKGKALVAGACIGNEHIGYPICYSIAGDFATDRSRRNRCPAGQLNPHRETSRLLRTRLRVYPLLLRASETETTRTTITVRYDLRIILSIHATNTHAWAEGRDCFGLPSPRVKGLCPRETVSTLPRCTTKVLRDTNKALGVAISS